MTVAHQVIRWGRGQPAGDQRVVIYADAKPAKLELGDLPKKPTRELSLGERMKCELIAALVHRPKVLFLDEPTIGLDVTMQAAVRSFVKGYNERFRQDSPVPLATFARR